VVLVTLLHTQVHSSNFCRSILVILLPGKFTIYVKVTDLLDFGVWLLLSLQDNY